MGHRIRHLLRAPESCLRRKAACTYKRTQWVLAINVVPSGYQPTCCGHCGGERDFNREATVLYDPAAGDWTPLDSIWRDTIKCYECFEIIEDAVRGAPVGVRPQPF